MLNGKHRQPGPVPGPLCTSYAHVLPVLDDLTDERLVADARAHLADCAWCRAQRTTYNRFDEALRLHFAPDAMPFLPIDAREFAMSDIHDSVAVDISPDEADGDADDEAPRLTVTPLPVPPQPPRRSWRLATGAASLAAVLVISLLAGLIFVSHGRPQSAANKHATSTPAIAPGSQNGLYAIGMSSATDGWAMGGANQGSNQGPAYVAHFTDGRWVPVKTPIIGGINAVKMLSATDGWAIGDSVYHYDGRSWREVSLPVQTQFNAIAIVSPNNIWIAGDGTWLGAPDGNVTILHYDGTTWSQQKTPSLLDNFTIYALSMVSAAEGWAVGAATSNSADSSGNAPLTGAILHYVNGTWRLAQTLPKYELRAISMVSAAAGWIGGDMQTISGGYRSANGQPQSSMLNVPVTLHYSHGQWLEVPFPEIGGTPAAGSVSAISLTSATSGWLFVGLDNQVLNPDDATYLAPGMFHLEHGRWTQVQAPLIQGRRYATIVAASIISADEFWGVGDTIWLTGIPSDTGSGYTPTVTPLIVHYKDGVWGVVEK